MTPEGKFKKKVCTQLKKWGCTVEGCEKEEFCRGLCVAHYANALRHDKSFSRLRIRTNKIKEHRREYDIWRSMKQRCFDKNHQAYYRYGGRGITVCDRWIGPYGFEHFYEDMGDKPDGKTLDREDNSKGYSPDNCRWATIWEQAKNTRKSDGRSLPVGVGYDKNKHRFTAYIQIGGEKLSKRFINKDDAISQRLRWEESICPRQKASSKKESVKL